MTLRSARLPLLMLLLLGCTTESSTSLKPDPGAGDYPDFQVYPDAELDAEPPDLDLPDAQVWVPSEHPTHDEVVVLSAGSVDYVFWYDGAAIRSRLLRQDGSWATNSQIVVELEEPPLGMVGAEPGSEPWLIFTGEGGRIFIWSPTSNDEPTALSLAGAPQVAERGTNMVVVGQPIAAEGEALAGGLAWQTVTDAGEPGPVIRDTLDLPYPDSVAGVEGSAVLRFSDAGQCTQLQGTQPVPLGHAPCQIGRGRLISDTSWMGVIHLEERAEGVVYALRPLFGPDRANPFFLGISGAGDEVNLTRFGLTGGQWPMVLRVLRPQPEVNGQLELVVAGPNRLQRSTDVWPSWPYPGVRGFAIREGLAYGLRFGDGDDPDLVEIPLTPVEFDGDVYDFTRDGGCQPTAEVCDNEDNDCDGRVDNGLCCLVPDDADQHIDQWVLNLGGTLQSFILGDVINRDAFDAAMRIGDDRWEGRQLFVRWAGGTRPLNGFRDPGSDENNVATFNEMYAWGPSGGCRIMIGRQEADGPIVARWTRSDDVNGDPRPTQEPVELEGCSEVLAADPTQPIDNQPESAIIVCPENMWRLYCKPDVELTALDPRLLLAENKVEFSAEFDDLPEGGKMTWGTITRSEDIIRDIFVGYRNVDGVWRLRSYQFGRQGAEEITDLPTPIAALRDSGEPLTRPIYLYGVASGTQVEVETGVATEQTRTPRMWVRGIGGFNWVTVSPAPAPGDRVEFMSHPRFKRLIYGREKGTPGIDDGVLEFWAFDLTERFGITPWASSPALTYNPAEEMFRIGGGDNAVEKPFAVDEAHPILWATHKGRYEPTLVIFGYIDDWTVGEGENEEKVGERWGVVYKRLLCRDP